MLGEIKMGYSDSCHKSFVPARIWAAIGGAFACCVVVSSPAAAPAVTDQCFYKGLAYSLSAEICECPLLKMFEIGSGPGDNTKLRLRYTSRMLTCKISDSKPKWEQVNEDVCFGAIFQGSNIKNASQGLESSFFFKYGKSLCSSPQ